MYYRKRLILYCERVYFLLKNTGIVSLVPLLVINIILPVFALFLYRARGLCDEFYKSISELSQIFLPFSSIWIPVLISKEFTDSDGKEILSMGRKSKNIWIILLMFLLYCCNIFMVFTLFNLLFSVQYAELVKIILVSVFYFGCTIFVSRITQNTSVTVLLLILYTLSNFIFYKMQGVFPFYYTNVPTTVTMIENTLLPLSLIGVLLCIFGCCIKIKVK